jgi:hypothetical protein
VRLMWRVTVCAAMILSLAAAFGKPAMAQPGQEMLPEQSAAKAKQLLQQVIGALGGQAFLNVRDTQCDGRVAQFGSNGDLMGYTMFRDMWLLPDKNRTDYISKGENSIVGFLLGVDGLYMTHGGVMSTVFDGDHGWMLDKSGVTDQPEDSVHNFTEAVKAGMNNMLRSRMNEPGVEASYAGTDLIDMKEAEWIEFTDRDRREMRLAVDRYTHLPLRWVVVTRDPETRERTEVITSYVQYLAYDGVKTPLNIVRARNDHKLTQTFMTSCKYNSSLAAQLFTRAALEQHAAEVSKKGYKDAKDSK